MAKCKIVLTATAGMTDFLDNCLSGIDQHCDMASVCVVVPDEQVETFEYLRTEYRFELLKFGDLIGRSQQEECAGQHYAEYGTAAFSDLMAIRVPTIQALLSSNDYVIFSDIDVAWIGNPLPYLMKVLDHCDVAMQTAAGDNYPPPFCMGFMAFRSCANTLDILDWFQTAYDADRTLSPTATMQVTLNRILRDEPSRARAIFPLPEALFPNGRLHRLFWPSAGARDLVKPPGSFIYHANYNIGAEIKRQMLQHVNMWTPRLVDEKQSLKSEISRLDRALKLERATAAGLAAKLAAEERQTASIQALLSERTQVAETLLSHVTAAYAEIEALKTQAQQTTRPTGTLDPSTQGNSEPGDF